MARKLRLEYAGAIYHVMNRGDRKELIFRDDADREVFLKTLGEAAVKSSWQVHAYCLMPNHFHLVLETPQPTLVAGMKWLLGTYTGRFNRKHKLVGHLFSGRYKSLIVDGSGDGYLKAVCDYVHLNLSRGKLLKPEQPLRTFPWSSWVEYMKPPSQRPAWLRVDRLLGEYRIGKDNAAGRRRLEEQLENRRRSEDQDAYQAIRRGWFLGDQELKKDLLGLMNERMGPEHYGEERQESQEEKAERVVREELKIRRWKEASLEARKKGDAEKVAIAVRLRRETMVTVQWIAQRLHMGSVAYVNSLLYQHSKSKQTSR